MFSMGLHLRRVVLVERRAPRARTYASTQARTYARTHSRRNEHEIKRRASALARAVEIAFCFIQEVLIIQCLGISAAEYSSPRSVSKHFEKSKPSPVKNAPRRRNAGLICLSLAFLAVKIKRGANLRSDDKC